MSPFIFSRRLGPRLARHLVFWGAYLLCAVPLHMNTISLAALADPELYRYTLLELAGFTPIYLLSVYVSLYYILPRYLASGNRPLLLFHIVSLLAVSTLVGYFSAREIIVLGGGIPDFVDTLAYAMHRTQANLTTLTVLAVLIKIMKDDYLRQQENELLAVENIDNRVRLLKLQLHPNILFSSLRSIYAEIEKETARAPRMILKLSDLLSYLLYESDTERVALSKEVAMLENYIQLKRLEFPTSMDIYLDTRSIETDASIPPGLFLPILEIGIQPPNDPQQHVTVDIEIRMTASKLYFNLTNDQKGIGSLNTNTLRVALDQLKARLQSLPGGKFKLNFQPGANGELSISMELKIDKMPIDL